MRSRSVSLRSRAAAKSPKPSLSLIAHPRITCAPSESQPSYFRNNPLVGEGGAERSEAPAEGFLNPPLTRLGGFAPPPHPLPQGERETRSRRPQTAARH